MWGGFSGGGGGAGGPVTVAPRKLRKGERITEAWIASLIDAIMAALRVAGGPGVEVRRTASGTTITRRESAFPRFAARITSVTVDPAVPNPASDTRYSARVLGRSDIDPLVGVKPYLGRPVDERDGDMEIWASKPGDPCEIWLVPDPNGSQGPNDPVTMKAVLCVLRERIAFCPPQSGGSSGGSGGVS